MEVEDSGMEEQAKDIVLAEPLERRRPCGYASETAGLMSANGKMGIVIVCLVVGLSASLYVNFLDRTAWRNQRVYFVGIQPTGSLVALDAGQFDFPITEANLRSRLGDFVKLHFERVRGRVEDDYTKSLQFLQPNLQAQRQSRDLLNIKSVLAGMAEEVRVDVRLVSLRNSSAGCEKSPCQATIIVNKSMYNGGSVRQQASSIELSFWVRPHEVTDRQIKAGNPMGLVITDLQEYSYFEPDDPGKTVSRVVGQ